MQYDKDGAHHNVEYDTNQRSSDRNRAILESDADLDLTKIYTVAPRPGVRHPKKAVFFAPKTRPTSTVMFANYADGWQSLAVCVSKLLSGQVFRFALGSDKEEWPLYLFEIIESGKEAPRLRD